MTRPEGGRAESPVRQPGPDLDQVLDAVATLIDAVTYTDAIRRADEITITSAYRSRPAGGAQLRDDATIAEEQARAALYELLDHEQVMRLIPRLSRRFKVAYRAEAAYEEMAKSERVADDADGVS